MINEAKAGMMYTSLALLPPVAVLCVACTPQASDTSREHPEYPAANLHDDTYEPGSNWSLAWSDEFDGDALDARKWRRQVEQPGRFNDEWQRYTDSADNAYIDSGCLVIRALHTGETHTPGAYTSARLYTVPENGWQYGKIAARIQLPFGNGIWPAFWMLGSNVDENGGDTPWPRSGEIDILEMYGSKDNAVVEANMHYEPDGAGYANMGAVSFRLEEGWFADNFHVFELEWDTESLRWFVDGHQFAAMSIAGDEFSEFHEKFFVLLNVAVGGRAAAPPDESTHFPQTMYVDWVRVYQRN